MTPASTPSAPSLARSFQGSLVWTHTGDVVGEDGQVELSMEDAGVLLDLSHAAQRVERAGGDEDVGAQLLGNAAVLEDALGLGVDDANHHAERGG